MLLLTVQNVLKSGYFCQNLITIEFSLQLLIEFPNLKFYENPSSESRFDACKQTDGRTDLTKLIGPFCGFVKVPKNHG
jgi:hypothetical protein